MMIKKTYWLLITILLVGLLAACTTPEPTPVPTDVPVIEPTPTEVVTTVTEPNTTSVSEKWCAGTDIVFFPGGPGPEAPFATTVYAGAVAAAADLGANVEYMFSDWDTNKMISQFSEAAAKKPDGIAIMGHPGDDAFAALVDDARENGIIVTSQNTTLPKLEAIYKADGFGYTGAENYSAGYALGAEAVQRFDLKAGDRALVWGLLSQAVRGERTQGIIDALQESDLVIDYIDIDDATNADAHAGTPVFVEYAEANPDVKLVVTDHGALTAIQETYFSAAGFEPDDIYGAGFDLSPLVVDGIRAGWVDLVIDQQPWLQGYLPILQICLTNNYAFTGLHIDTGAGFAHAENIELLADLVEENIR
jgi:simple sugar transport system substrate-binding protein